MFALFRSVLFFFSPLRLHERLIMIYSWTKRLLNQQRWNRCFLTLLSPCSITLQQMRCQKKRIEICFIAPLSLSANGFNYLTKIVSRWKSEKNDFSSLLRAGPEPKTTSSTHPANHATLLFQISINFLSLSCCFSLFQQAQTWKNRVLRLYNNFTSFLFFPVSFSGFSGNFTSQYCH